MGVRQNFWAKICSHSRAHRPEEDTDIFALKSRKNCKHEHCFSIPSINIAFYKLFKRTLIAMILRVSVLLSTGNWIMTTSESCLSRLCFVTRYPFPVTGTAYIIYDGNLIQQSPFLAKSLAFKKTYSLGPYVGFFVCWG